jgi:hypothetical protein
MLLWFLVMKQTPPATGRYYLVEPVDDRKKSGRRRKQLQQPANGVDIGANLVRRYFLFVVPLPLQEQGFNGLFAVRVADGFDGRASA